MIRILLDILWQTKEHECWIVKLDKKEVTKKFEVYKFVGVFMFYIIILIFLACFNCGSVHAKNGLQPKKFVIVTASYNNIDYVDKYLKSIFSQKCDEREFTFRVIYYDDCSEDGTGEFVEAYKKKFDLGDKFCIIRNKARIGGHENIYHAIHSCKNKEINLIL